MFKVTKFSKSFIGDNYVLNPLRDYEEISRDAPFSEGTSSGGDDFKGIKRKCLSTIFSM